MAETSVTLAAERDVQEMAQRRRADSQSRRLYAELAAVAPNGAWVAKDEGTIVGIAVAHQLDTQWYLSELFVEPSFRGQGLGGKLLDEAARNAGDAGRSGILDPRELSSVAFFTRRGVPAHTPVLRVSGRIPREEELARMAAGEHRFRTETIDPLRHRHALDALDRETRGSARQYDHLYFASRAAGSAFFVGDESVGYVYVWPDGRIGPLASAAPSYLVPFFAFALMSLARAYGASWCSVLVPATNVRIARAATRAGLTIDGVLLFATDEPALDLTRYLGFHELLF